MIVAYVNCYFTYIYTIWLKRYAILILIIQLSISFFLEKQYFYKGNSTSYTSLQWRKIMLSKGSHGLALGFEIPFEVNSDC
jgi:hypothetical protein